MAGVPLSPETRRRLDVLFPGRNREEAEALLLECGDSDRLRFAALKLSGGNYRKLVEAVELAKIDWRDLLMAAGFGYDVRAHEDWEPL
jgi:hypothetical protein